MMDEVRGQGKKTARALAGASVHEPTLLSTVLRQSRAKQTGYIYIHNKIDIYIYNIYIRTTSELGTKLEKAKSGAVGADAAPGFALKWLMQSRRRREETTVSPYTI